MKGRQMKTPGRTGWSQRIALPAGALTLLPGLADASMHFAELSGVPEQLGAHSLNVDCDWLWATLLLLAVVGTLWGFSRRDRRK